MEMITAFSSKSKQYKLYFQGSKYSNDNFETYYKSNCNEGESIEFLPGIFYSYAAVGPKGVKGVVISLLGKYKIRSMQLRMLSTFLVERWEDYIVTLTFKNARDDYSLYIDDKLVFCNKKAYKGKELLFSTHDYERINCEPEYLEVLTEKILLPCQSGGDGSRCSLKGTFKSLNLLRTDTYNAQYFFFNEYEMHCLAMHSEKIRSICKQCSNCMKTIALMSKKKFIGPTKGNNSDGLLLEKYNETYIIGNGNHRACCAKVFGIPTVKAMVYRYKRVEYEQSEAMPEKEQRSDNIKVLESFYQVFHDNKISDKIARTYLQQDGTDLALIELLGI